MICILTVGVVGLTVEVLDTVVPGGCRILAVVAVLAGRGLVAVGAVVGVVVAAVAAVAVVMVQQY